MFKKFIIIIIGILIALVFAEIILRIFPPKILNPNKINDKDKEFFKWAYLDIHEPFFKIDGNKFYIQRKEYFIQGKNNQKEYVYNKQDKRIFILGESTAKLYPEEMLKQKLLEYFNCEVINCGMGAYDSYRIEKISKEIAKLKPDWIICFIGHNDYVFENQDFIGIPFSFNPIDINYLPYKHPFIRKFFTLNLLSNIICKEIKLETQNELEIFFKKNILKIVKNLKNCKIIFIDLPNNENFYYCSNIYDIIEIENNGTTFWKDRNHYKILKKRLRFIENLQQKHNNIFYTNLTVTLLDYCNNELGYNIFIDDCHWTRTTNELLTEIITKIILKQDLDKDIEIEISKEDFNKKLINDYRRFISYGTLDYLIKNNFDYAKDNYIDERKIFKENILNKDIYNDICIYAYCLYKNNYTTLSLNILDELISLQPNYVEAYLTLGYIYYTQNNIKKATEYFDIAKKLEPDSKINVEYLKSLKEEKK